MTDGVGQPVPAVPPASHPRPSAASRAGTSYTYPIVEVYEFDDELKIVRKHNYYDKLAILRMIAAELPGAQGIVDRFLLERVIDAGETGLTRPGNRSIRPTGSDHLTIKSRRHQRNARCPP